MLLTYKKHEQHEFNTFHFGVNFLIDCGLSLQFFFFIIVIFNIHCPPQKSPI